ncbi:response regulator transcription factor [Listeria booriae]|uniref:Heme response regulator HssR n=1 Tax=Listeria booriae TaxID=1552123 RepID=A0A841ZX12_9LIST|nr:response regulator transcription factor [Listeria booriae]MBC1565299.1 response regulator transcription factor [Listeria booriae]MBC1648626.1 response regulator transcription factor [Listeria booriae]MBC2256635.1 response regulator transcription factor [Listeria booriae]MBC6129904.1 response regulator transcription factor [Listeria booriae]MBC6166930.1 response regulator transcription factor [Listeria booriae]
MNRILMVDDDSNIRELVTIFLEKEGFTVFNAQDGVDALSVLEKTTVDLAVIDIMMPNMDGWELCSAIKSFQEIPVIFLTARGEIEQKIKGFSLGADDYVVKPFAPEELVARIRVLLKRYQILATQEIRIGNISLNEKEMLITSQSKVITLPLKEFQLLFRLAGYPDKTFSREQLIEEIWGYDYEGDERTVDVHIKRLREKFPAEQSGFTIRTIRGLGYRLEEL